MNKPLNVGLIGYGFAGRTFHAPVIAAVPELALAKVVERGASRSKERYPWVEVVRDAAALYDDASIDLVVVATPSTDHVRFARDALLAGKHVVVEKPFAPTSAEADELIALANAKGRTLTVFHNRRWDGDFLTVRDIVRRGWLGRLCEVEMRWDRYHPVPSPERWRDGGEPGSGVFYDLGVHFIDQALCLFGKPAAIAARVGAQRDGAVADDSFDVRLEYEDGLAVRLKASLLARSQGPRYALHGTLGSFVKYGEDPQEEALKAGRTPLEPRWGEEPEERWGRIDATVDGVRFVGNVQTQAGAYQRFYRNVYDHIAGLDALAVRPEEARDAIRLLELGMRSSRERRTIPIDWNREP